jgi:hypothetical protein
LTTFGDHAAIHTRAPVELHAAIQAAATLHGDRNVLLPPLRAVATVVRASIATATSACGHY